VEHAILISEIASDYPDGWGRGRPLERVAALSQASPPATMVGLNVAVSKQSYLPKSS